MPELEDEQTWEDGDVENLPNDWGTQLMRVHFPSKNTTVDVQATNETDALASANEVISRLSS